MQLDVNRLEKVVEQAGGAKRARCPACAEGGHDKTGNHLWIKADGRYGCCVYPEDHPHRSRIFALAGDRGEAAMKVRPRPLSPSFQPKKGVFGMLAQTHGSKTTPPAVAAPMAGLGTSAPAGVSPSTKAQSEAPVRRTPRTVDLNSLSEEKKGETAASPHKEVPTGVRAVREPVAPLPGLAPDGTLAIPFGSPEKYHWWKGGQSVAETRAELTEGHHW